MFGACEIASRSLQMEACQTPARFGFRFGDVGAHTGRTMMLAEITGLLQGCARDAIRENYRRAILEDNVLGKKTASNRVQTFKRLSALYALDPKVLVFRAFRDFWYRAEEGRPLLALLCAAARDPLLRMTAPPVLDAREGEVVTWESLKAAVAEAAPDRFTEITLTAIAKRAHSSWEQSGHLRGRLSKHRSHPVLTPVNTVFAVSFQMSA